MKRERNKKSQKSQDPQAKAGPWTKTPTPRVFVTLWTTGSDPAVESLLRIRALRIDPGATAPVEFDRWCQVPEDAAPRCAGELPALLPPEDLDAGLEALATGGEALSTWAAFTEFVGESDLFAPDAEGFGQWALQYGGEGAAMREACGLAEVAALLFPGRLSNRREGLVLDLIADGDSRPTERSIGPADLREAMGDLATRFLTLDTLVVETVGATLAAAWSRLFVTDAFGARRIARVLTLVTSVEDWIDRALPRFAALDLDTASRLAQLDWNDEELQGALGELEPRWNFRTEPWASTDPLPPDREEPLPFQAEDEVVLDVVFRRHLPALFAAEASIPLEDAYRQSQHDVAREVARNFGSNDQPETQLLLVHAPTGTGKTLAYLLPALLWARRNEVRVGVATYTRALQEQAIDREVPRALEALRHAGVAPGFRVTMLKGRENYLCWRALKLHAPDENSAGEAWLAFQQLMTFALTDAEGDLNRLPRRPPIEMESSKAYRATFFELVRHVRAQTSCCKLKVDRSTCGAEVARWRAERSHLVVTNHSFALARQEFFRHLVFDECEHLHDQAHSAWSHVVEMRQVTSLLDRLHKPDSSRSRSLFRRVERKIVDGTPSARTLEQCRQAWEILRAARLALAGGAERFERWRLVAQRERGERDDHSMMREYIESDEGEELIRARLGFVKAGNGLDEQLAELAERLEGLGQSRTAHLRRSVDLMRTELVEIIDAICAWLPLQEGRPVFNKRTFHDIEVNPGGEMQLAARVLLPNEYLGRIYYPQLSTASFLSATTLLRGGFEAAKAYLGLDRSVEPDPDPDGDGKLLPCVVKTFRAPEVFDYSRALVAIPRDAPAISREKEAFLQYARDFIADLGERTGGRMLVLFTNSEDVKRVGERLEGHFRARRTPFWYQNMPGTTKEELSELFRRHTDSVLLGVDTFWYGADFPGETLEYLVIMRLPYGVPDRYHHAQCAALGIAEQRRQIYMPRALAKFRQGFGRLMRRVTDRGAIFILDHRIVDPRHRVFLRELPIAAIGESQAGLARLVRGDTDRCLHQALVHMELESEAAPLTVDEPAPKSIERFEPIHETHQEPSSAPMDVDLEDLPF